MNKNIDSCFYDNSFSFIRYFAAFQVLIKHLVIHFNLDLPNCFFSLLDFFSGVPIFFCLSGFFISNTLNKDKVSGKEYFRKRFIRIFPELWLAILVNDLFLILFNSSILSDIKFWLFNITQGSFFQFWTPDTLRNYGVGTPNGSLWTITLFIQFYVLIYFLFPKIKDKSVYFHFLLLFSSLIPNVAILFLEQYIPTIVYKLFLQTIIPYFYLFYIGVIIYLYRNHIIDYLIRYFYFLFIVFILYSTFLNNFPSVYMDPIRTSLLCLLTIGFGYKFKTVKIRKDYSFGIYLYHMIFINIFVNYNVLNNWLGAMFIAIISIIVAIFSNKLFYTYLKIK